MNPIFSKMISGKNTSASNFLSFKMLTRVLLLNLRDKVDNLKFSNNFFFKIKIIHCRTYCLLFVNRAIEEPTTLINFHNTKYYKLIIYCLLAISVKWTQSKSIHGIIVQGTYHQTKTIYLWTCSNIFGLVIKGGKNTINVINNKSFWNLLLSIF